MRVLLDALQEGRLVELPEGDRDHALEYLALLLEAIPDSGKSDIVQDVIGREHKMSTAIGFGVAIPHARTNKEGELLCAVGWSPKGIDFGAPDGRPVNLVIIYHIPDSHRNLYLKEVSTLVKAIRATKGIPSEAKDLQEVRISLLDWISSAIEGTGPDQKARMIMLSAKSETLPARETIAVDKVEQLFGNLILFEMVVVSANQCIVLSAEEDLVKRLEGSPYLAQAAVEGKAMNVGGYRITLRNERTFSSGRRYLLGAAFKTDEIAP
jgi:nitrogen PTS system EIIA component